MIDGGTRFVMIENSSLSGLLTRYQHPNHQASCTLETNESGDVITYEEYHPFGTTNYVVGLFSGKTFNFGLRSNVTNWINAAYDLMGLININTKLKGNALIKDAGKYFVDETSDVIKELNLKGESAFLGIQNKKGVYTIIGKDHIYYLTSSGNKGKILHQEFSNELHENGSRIGKGWLKFKFKYRNIILKNNDEVWLYNAKTMFSLWSIIAWIERNKWEPAFQDLWDALRRDL